MMDEFVLEIIAKREMGMAGGMKGRRVIGKGGRWPAGAWLFNIHRREASK